MKVLPLTVQPQLVQVSLRNGWMAARCAFEREISQMATPATDVLDCKAWDCANDLEKFILQYKKSGGANKCIRRGVPASL